MMFPRIQLSELVTIKGGKRLKPSEEFSTVPTQHPYIRARDVGGGVIKIQDAVYLTETVAQRLSRYRVNTGDVCITIVGANVGEMGIVPSDLDGANLTENCVRLTGNARVTQGFLRYALLTDDAQGQMKVVAGGAAQPKLGIYKIEAVDIPLPLLPTQHKIAAILSAYDDLIENNTRRIAILEEMAQAIYREWFVNFRFPGHENVKLVDTPLGQIPEGWVAGTIADYVTNGELELQTGPFGTQLKASDYTESGTPVINVRNIGYGSIRPDKLEHVPVAICERLAQHLLETGDIVFGRKGAVDRHVLITKAEHGWMQGSDCIRMRSMSERALPQLLTFAFRDESHHDWMLSQCSHGATMASLNQDVIKRIPILLPSSDFLDRFFEISSDVLRAVSVLQRRNSNLRTTRDLLLPKLISGQLDVEDLDIDVGMTAEELTEAAAG